MALIKISLIYIKTVPGYDHVILNIFFLFYFIYLLNVETFLMWLFIKISHIYIKTVQGYDHDILRHVWMSHLD